MLNKLVFEEFEGVVAGGGDEGFYLVTGRGIGLTEGSREVEAFSVDVTEFHIGQNGFLEELGRHLRGILLFAEVAGINLARTLKHADVHDIVVIHILYLKTIVVVSAIHNLILGGVDGDVPMVAVATERDDGVGLHLMGVVEHGWRVVSEFGGIDGIIALLQLYHIAIGIEEEEQMRGKFSDGVRGARAEHERVAHDAEVGGHRGRVGEEDGIALDTERHIATLSINPDALQLLLGFFVFNHLAILTATSRQ